MNIKLIINIFILSFSIVWVGCGFYSLKGSLPAHIQSISVSPVINESTEFSISELMNSQLNELMINENVLELVSREFADSQLDVSVKSITDKPYTYTLESGQNYEQVEEWKITIKAKVVWYDLINNTPLFEKDMSEWGAYGTGVDINSDKIDNDNDGLIDSEDDDEIGPPRDSAIKIAVRKLTERIGNEITSTW